VIEKTQAAIAKYKAIKQGMLQDLFTRGIDLSSTSSTTYGKLRPRYEDAPHLYKESKLGMIPREWDVDTLGKVINVSSGEGLTQENLKPGIHPVYGGNGINGYHAEFLFAEERLIIGRVGEYCGKALITKQFSWITDNALVVTNIEREFIPKYWEYYINHLDLNSIAFTGAQPVVTGGLINKVVLKKIPPQEQQRIAQRLNAIDNKLQIEQTYLRKMHLLKKGLMEDLLSGKKCLNLDLQDEQISTITANPENQANHQIPDSDNNPVNPKIK
jgi:type I restriction enzyme, S subunit